MTKVINLRKKNNFKFEIPKKSKGKINNNTEIYKVIFLLISIISILFGCLVFKSNQIDFLEEVCNNFILNIQNKSYFNILFYYIKFDVFFFIITFFIGTSFIGAPLASVPLITKCMYVGYLSSYMYCEYDLKGILFSLVLLYPMLVITTTSLIYASNESSYMSKHILNIMTNKNTADNISIKLYILRYAILLGINIICIAVNSFLIMILASKFNLH